MATLSEQFEQFNNYSERIPITDGVTVYLVLAADSLDGLTHGALIDDVYGIFDEQWFPSDDAAHELVAEMVALQAEMDAEAAAMGAEFDAYLESIYSEDSWDDPRSDLSDGWDGDDWEF